MATKNDFIKLYREAFRSTRRWDEWFLGEVYREEDMLALEADGKTVSVLLAQPYRVSLYGADLQASYLSCVATAAAERGKGHMSRLMAEAIAQSAARGDAFAMLIPESKRLYFFYGRFGFATAFYVDEQRFTSVHSFIMPDEYEPIEPTFETLEALEKLPGCCVRHTGEDFRRIMRDLEIDGGKVVAVEGPEGSKAMAFARTGDLVTVRALPSTDTVAAEAALAVLRSEVGESPMAVWADPADKVDRLRARGMARIIDASAVLAAVAAAHPKISMAIRVHDPMVEANNAVFVLSHGECRAVPYDGFRKKPDLDVRIDVLAMILFSAPSVASVFDLPGTRPAMHLMLD